MAAAAKEAGAAAFAAADWAGAQAHYVTAAGAAAAAGDTVLSATCNSNAAQAALNRGAPHEALQLALAACAADGRAVKAAYRAGTAVLALMSGGGGGATSEEVVAAVRVLAAGAASTLDAAMADALRRRAAEVAAAAAGGGAGGGGGGSGSGSCGLGGSPPPLLRAPPPAAALDARFGSRALYKHAADGTDENLLICLHGLGDRAESMAAFAAAMALPQTAVWAIQAPQEVPLVGGGAWYTALDAASGEPLPPGTPHARRAADICAVVEGALATLTALADAGWTRDAIHLLGLGDGATVALHLAAACADAAARRTCPPGTTSAPLLGSIVACGGDLLPDALPPAPAAPARVCAAALPRLFHVAFHDGGSDGAGARASDRSSTTTAARFASWWGEPSAPIVEGGARPREPAAYTVVRQRGAPRLPATRADMYPVMAHFGASLRRRLVALERDPTVIRIA